MSQKPNLANLIIAKSLKNDLKHFVNVNFPSLSLAQSLLGCGTTQHYSDQQNVSVG